MGYKREELKPAKDAIYSFTNTITLVAGIIDLKIYIGTKKERE